VYLNVTSDMGFYKWFANAHAPCEKPNIVITPYIHSLFDITFCLWLYTSCISLCCNFL